MLLRAEGIDAGYGSTRVLRGVDIVVPERSVVALLGPNGAGKTTLLRTLAGLLTPTGGSLTFAGHDITATLAARRAELGLCLIPEGRGVFRSLTVRENLVLHARTGTEDDSIERATTAFPRLGERLSQQAGTLSGGEQQMLALARAYVRDPDLVLLDEVSMGLAPRIIDEIFEFLSKMAATGSALLLVEQYVERALEIADLVVVLNRGTVSFFGEPAELDHAALSSHYLGATG